MRYRLVIYDFDGTLADSLPWFVSVVNELAERFGFRHLDESELERLRELGAREVIRELGIAWWKVPLIAAYMRRRTSRDLERITLFAGAERLLRTLHAAGVSQAIVTSNARGNVLRILGPETAALIDHFECGAPVFGKRSRFARVLRRTGVAPMDALAVGDEIRDVQAAHALGIPFGAVSWGYSTADALRRLAPEEIFSTFDEIAEAVLRRDRDDAGSRR